MPADFEPLPITIVRYAELQRRFIAVLLESESACTPEIMLELGRDTDDRPALRSLTILEDKGVAARDKDESPHAWWLTPAGRELAEQLDAMSPRQYEVAIACADLEDSDLHDEVARRMRRKDAVRQRRMDRDE